MCAGQPLTGPHRPLPLVRVLCGTLPPRCRLDLVTHFSTSEHREGEGMSLLKLGYKEAVASVSGAPSLARAL